MNGLILANINTLKPDETHEEALKEHLKALNRAPFGEYVVKDTGVIYTSEEIAARREARLKRGDR